MTAAAALIVVGALIIAALFIGMSAFAARIIGWREVLGAWVFTLATVVVASAGVFLIMLGASSA